MYNSLSIASQNSIERAKSDLEIKIKFHSEPQAKWTCVYIDTYIVATKAMLKSDELRNRTRNSLKYLTCQ